jgi:hypothetical protein
MIYRILCEGPRVLYEAFTGRSGGKAECRLMGAWAAGAGDGPWELLPGPSPKQRINPRARFYFTEKGWQQVGRVAARNLLKHRKQGVIVRVLRRKNPDPSQVVYEDELQVAILPRKAVPRKKRK